MTLMPLIFDVLALSHLLTSAGTLVVIIPTRDGIVVAADSRTTVREQYCDNGKKLNVIPNTNLIFTITGTGNFLPEPPKGTNLCEWILKATPLFNGDQIITEFFKIHAPEVIDEAFLLKLSNSFSNALEIFLAKRKNLVQHYLGQELCQVAIAQYEPIIKESIIASFVISIVDYKKVAEVTKSSLERFKPDDPFVDRILGESEYFTKQVIQGTGKQFLKSNFFTMRGYINKISDLSYNEGAYLAESMIAAASKMSEIVPPKNGIGGEIQVILIDGESVSGFRTLKRGKDFD